MRRLFWIGLVVMALAWWPAPASAQALAPVISHQFFDNSGAVCASCELNTWASGTTTNQATYSDSALATANANPLVLDSAGRATIFLSANNYRFRLRTSAAVTIFDVDNVSYVPSGSGNTDVSGTAGVAITAGQVVYLSDGSGALTAGRWYLADADNTYSSTTAPVVGIAVGAIASAGTGTIRLSGRITGLTSLTAGESYYISATAGALTGTPPINSRFIGGADTTTTLVFAGDAGGVRLPDSDGTNLLVLITTSNLTADRRVTILPGDSNRQVTLSGDLTVSNSATVSQDYSTTGTPGFNTVGISDSDASHYLRLETTSNLTADRQLTIVPGDAARTLTFTGDATLPQTSQPGLTAVRVYTANATWTKPASLHSIVVWVVGGGGGGGGTIATVVSEQATANGGGGGGTSIERILEATLGATEAVTVGASGAGGVAGNNAGAAGGTSSFGALLSATGGGGGAGGGVSGNTTTTNTGAVGSAGAGASGDLNFTGQPGGRGFGIGFAIGGISGFGGASSMGGGAAAATAAAGVNAGNYGGGGSGANADQNVAARAGGAGTAGVVIVYEYSN